MAVRSKLLAVGGSTSTTGELVYTVPTGYTTIVKSIRLACGGGSVQTYYVGGSIGSGLAWVFYETTLSYPEISESPLWVVFPAGFAMTVQSVQGSACYFWISGTELLGEPAIPTVPTASTLDRPVQLPGPFPPPALATVQSVA